MARWSRSTPSPGRITKNAQTAAAQARADVAAQQAALRTAEIDLARTTIRAPIGGRIGRSAYTTGALVTAAQAEPLATIQRIDPIYVDIQQSSADLLKLRQQILAGQVSRDGNARVRLLLEDGSSYGTEGTLRFADVTVDATTGSQVIRAVFGNRAGLLLPGMFVRTQLAQGNAAEGDPDPAARRQPRRTRQPDGDGRRPRQQGRAPAPCRPAGRSATTGW